MGARARRVEKYYQDLLSPAGDSTGSNNLNSDNSTKELSAECVYVPEKWKGQIEKVIRCMNCVLYYSVSLCVGIK